MKFEDFINEGKWKKLPKGWDESSIKKFAKSLTDKGADEHGFFDACVKKMTRNIDDPEGFCATVKDTIYSSTFWRGKAKSKKEIAKDVKEHPLKEDEK